MPHFLKRTIKSCLHVIAANFGRHTRKPVRAELLLLMYHRILPADDPRALLEEPGMMVTPATFKLHMEIVKSLFETTHLSHWLALKKNGLALPPRCCAITFDDGWADNYEYAYPILQELNIPATIFLVSDMIGKQQKFWPERLAQLITTIARDYPDKWAEPSLTWLTKNGDSYDFSSTLPTQEQLSAIIATTKSLSDEDIHQRIDNIEQQLNIVPTENKASLLNWEQMNEMCHSGLVEAGSHTCHHIRLTDDKDPAVLNNEIINSKLNIEKHIGTVVKTFCYPNGDYSDNAQSLVKQHYDGAVTTARGWNTIENDDYLLHRIGLHEDISNSKNSFLAKLSGWL